MGATPQEDFAMNFLAALNNIWSEHPGTLQVAEMEEILPALAQITIRWLAARARERLGTAPGGLQVRGDVRYDVSEIQPSDAFRQRRTITLGNSLNRIVHAEPEWVSVQRGEVILCWKKERSFTGKPIKDRAYCAYFLADDLIASVRRALYSEDQRRHQVAELEQKIRSDAAYAGLYPRTIGVVPT